MKRLSAAAGLAHSRVNSATTSHFRHVMTLSLLLVYLVIQRNGGQTKPYALWVHSRTAHPKNKSIHHAKKYTHWAGSERAGQPFLGDLPQYVGTALAPCLGRWPSFRAKKVMGQFPVTAFITHVDYFR